MSSPIDRRAQNPLPLVVVFLDIDGVLINSAPDIFLSHYIKTSTQEILLDHPEYSRKLATLKATSLYFSPIALHYLNESIQKISQVAKVAIVISSEWRKQISLDDFKNHVFSETKFYDLIIDKTPDFESNQYLHSLDTIRRKEIQSWLQKNSEALNITNFVAIEGLSLKRFGILKEFKSQKTTQYENHLIQIDADRLFSAEHKYAMDQILAKNTEFE